MSLITRRMLTGKDLPWGIRNGSFEKYSGGEWDDWRIATSPGAGETARTSTAYATDGVRSIWPTFEAEGLEQDVSIIQSKVKVKPLETRYLCIDGREIYNSGSLMYQRMTFGIGIWSEVNQYEAYASRDVYGSGMPAEWQTWATYYIDLHAFVGVPLVIKDGDVYLSSTKPFMTRDGTVEYLFDNFRFSSTAPTEGIRLW